MWTISLDEGGYFEVSDLEKTRKSCMFVGGAIYHCDSPEQAEEEARRLVRFFQTTCLKENVRYPEDLHFDFQTRSNGDACRRAKEALIRSLGDFLTGKKAWAKDAPQGYYELYAIVGDKNGMDDILQSRNSNLIDDSVASNRYEHMAYRVIQNLLFHNLHATDDHIRMDLATRAFFVGSDRELQRQARENGAKSIGSFENRYVATDGGNYRAMLLTNLMDADRSNIHFNLNIKSIQYKPGHDEQAFLYLADTVCSAFDEALRDAPDCSAGLGKLFDYGQNLLGAHHSYFWAYDAIDVEYRKVYKAYQQKDSFHALLLLNELRRQNSVLSELYDKIWLQDIEDSIRKTVKLRLEDIQNLNRYLEMPSYRLNIAKKILPVFEDQARQIEDIAEQANLIFRFFKVEMIVLNHCGQHELAMECYQNAMSYAFYVPIEEYFEMRNLMSVAMLNSLRYGDAARNTEETIEYIGMQSQIKKAMFPGVADRNQMLGRTYSQLGQCYAFDGEYEKACEQFRHAFDAYGDNPVDHQKTRSYYLHALIEAGDSSAYEKENALYFGTSDVAKQLDAIQQQDDLSRKFALFVYVKGLYRFYLSKLPSKQLREITQKLKEFYQAYPDGHPWELILKYCALISLHILPGKENLNAANFIRMAEEAVQDSEDGILHEIMKEGRIQYENASRRQKDIYANTVLQFMYR